MSRGAAVAERRQPPWEEMLQGPAADIPKHCEAADEAREDFKRVERMLRKELTRRVARKEAKRKKAAKQAREKVKKKGKKKKD